LPDHGVVPDHGVAGSARRYTLIVAMLVMLAAVPTAGLLAAGQIALDEGEGAAPDEPPRGPQPGGPPVVLPAPGPLGGLPGPGGLPRSGGGSLALHPPASGSRPGPARFVRQDGSGGSGRVRRHVAHRGGSPAPAPVPPPVVVPPPMPVPPPPRPRCGHPVPPVPPQQRDRRGGGVPPVPVLNQRQHRHQDRAGYPVGRNRGGYRDSALPRR
jgi:hypothetical protein